MASGDTRTEQLLSVLATGTREDIPESGCCNTKTQNYILGAINRMIDLEEEVEWLENNPDVADIVATYAALEDYDTSQLTDNAIVRVLADEEHDGQSTFYRWNASTETWTYIGAVGDYYTKDQVDDLLDTKQDTLTAGDNITIEEDATTGELVISATGGGGGGGTYTAGTGLTLSNYEFSVDDTVVALQTDLPTVNDATLTITQDGTTMGTFTANSSTNTTIALTDNDTTYTAGTGLTLSGTEFSADTSVLATQTDLASKQDTLTAGTNVSISNNVISATDTTYTAGSNITIDANNEISATDTTYTAGTGLTLSGTEFSADTSVLATQTDLSSKQDTLTAGTNISISNNTISATDTTYTAGTGLTLSGTEFSADTSTLATITYVDTAVAGASSISGTTLYL